MPSAKCIFFVHASFELSLAAMDGPSAPDDPYRRPEDDDEDGGHGGGGADEEAVPAEDPEEILSGCLTK